MERIQNDDNGGAQTIYFLHVKTPIYSFLEYYVLKFNLYKWSEFKMMTMMVLKQSIFYM